jgi:3-deoxy-D-manno-octulosonic-acid transferase
VLSPDDPLAQLRLQLRWVQRRLILNTFLVEPFRILRQGRQRWRWLLGQWGLSARRSRQTPKSLWIHAAAAGEMKVALALARALPEDLPVVISYSSFDHPLGGEDDGGRAEIVSLPHPFGFVMRRFLRRYSPRQLVLVEMTDLVPLLCLRLARREIPTALVNGRIHGPWFEVRRMFLPLLADVRLFGVRDEEDRELLEGIGIERDRIHLTGDLKFDGAADALPEIEARVQELAGGRPILVAGSTNPDEAPQVLDAFAQLGGGDRALLVLAPRHTPDCDPAEPLLRDRSLGFVRRSDLPHSGSDPASGRPAVLLLDQMGELAALYRLAAAVFLGASLSPDGHGRNPVEPARFGVPIAVGPNTANLGGFANLFDGAGAWQRVADADELARAWTSWLDDPELARRIGRRAADLVEAQQGLALARTVELLRPFLGLEDRPA